MDPSYFNLHIDQNLFFITFGIIFLAELPDKTALAILIMASQKNPVAVFLGVCGAFFIQNIIAVLFGSLFGFLPPQIVHVCSGILFLIFAYLMWKQREEKPNKKTLPVKGFFLKTIWSSFIVIFIAEWGDLTQLAAATLIAKTHQPVTIFLSATLALWTTTGLAVLIGAQVKKIIRPHILQTIAAVVFAIVGLVLLFEVFAR